jgi:hypothetical protein
MSWWIFLPFKDVFTSAIWVFKYFDLLFFLYVCEIKLWGTFYAKIEQLLIDNDNPPNWKVLI